MTDPADFAEGSLVNGGDGSAARHEGVLKAGNVVHGAQVNSSERWAAH